jgi:hypothetical protein
MVKALVTAAVLVRVCTLSIMDVSRSLPSIKGFASDSRLRDGGCKICAACAQCLNLAVRDWLLMRGESRGWAVVEAGGELCGEIAPLLVQRN